MQFISWSQGGARKLTPEKKDIVSIMKNQNYKIALRWANTTSHEVIDREAKVYCILVGAAISRLKSTRKPLEDGRQGLVSSTRTHAKKAHALIPKLKWGIRV